MNKEDKPFQSHSSIPNEFSPSLINYHIEHHANQSTPAMNQAELYAMQEEQKRQIEQMKKKELYHKNLQKCKENIQRYKEAHKEDNEDFSQTNKRFRHQMKEKTKEYNESLRQTVLQKQKRKSAPGQSSIVEGVYQPSPLEEGNNSNEQIQQSKILDTFSFQNPNEEEQKSQLQYLNMQTNESSNSLARNLREELEDQISSQQNCNSIYQKSSSSNKEELPDTLHDRINSNIQMVKNFRKTGLIMMTGSHQTETSVGVMGAKEKGSETMSIASQTKQTSQANGNGTNHPSDLQQRRYQKALKKLMIEQLQNKSVNIPSICSCGQLQTKIDSLILGGKAITPHDLMNVDCANNCIYYQKPSDYHRALTDIIQSIRTLKIDSK